MNVHNFHAMITGMAVPLSSVSSSHRTARVGALLLWAATGLSASYWGMQMWGVVQPTPLPPLAIERPPVNAAAVAKALGAAGDVPVVATVAPTGGGAYRLQGVLRDASGEGVALIAMDGQAAKPYRLGATLPGGQVLLELQTREVLLGAGATDRQRLQLPARCSDQACKNKR
jgi:general secretion pathway protein C